MFFKETKKKEHHRIGLSEIILISFFFKEKNKTTRYGIKKKIVMALQKKKQLPLIYFILYIMYTLQT